MAVIRIDSLWELRLPPEAVEHIERTLLLRVLAGWAGLLLLAGLVV